MATYEISVWKDYLKTIYREISISGTSPNFILVDINGKDITDDLPQIYTYISTVLYPCTILSISSPTSISIKYFNGTTNVTVSVNKIYTEQKYFDEKKIATIGSNTLNSAIAVFGAKLTSNIDGTSKLTFSLFNKYITDEGEKEDNPFVGLLKNETKIKLKYNDSWYSLNINNVDEDSNSNTFTYTSEEIYIEELSKTGFELIFDTELENNSGTIIELAQKAVNGTDWDIDVENSDILIQTSEEPLYTATLLSAMTVTNLNPSAPTQTKVYPLGSLVYIYYSSITERENKLQVVFSPSFKTDDNMVIIDNNTYYNYYVNVTFDETSCYGPTSNKLFDLSSLSLSDAYRGKKTIVKNLTRYESNYGGYVDIFHKNSDISGGVNPLPEYFRYSEYEYITTDIARNLITNAKEFLSPAGWKGASNTLLATAIYPQYIGTSSAELVAWLNAQKVSLISVKNSNTAPALICNSGIRDSASSISSLVSGEKYYLKVKCRNSAFAQITSGLPLSAKIQKHSSTDDFALIENPSITFTGFTYDATSKFWTSLATVSETFSKDSLLNSFLYFTIAGSADFYLEEVQLFKRVLDSQGDPLTPDSIPEAQVKTKFTYYSLIPGETGDAAINKVYSDYIPSPDYTAAQDPYHQKVRSISIKESNRFNIIQTLCETFECWADFKIAYEPNGRVRRDTAGHPIKTISFRKFVGKDNYAGFKYGINLNSTKRTTISNQLVSKLIVKNNTNQFADSGFCSIARAPSNESKENFIYNFNYFFNHGLLDYGQTMSDLYYTGGTGLQFLYKIGQLNNQYDVATDGYVAANTLLTQLTAKKTTYEQTISSAKNEIIAYDNLLFSATNGYRYADLVSGQYNSLLENPQVKSYLISIETLNSHVASSTAILTSVNAALAETKDEITNFLNLQKTITSNKAELSKEFFNRYAAFIKEGTWISEEYLDDELYYLDAKTTGNTSAFPQVSYNFQVTSVNSIEDFENYKFSVGDKTYVEDTEFFGYVTRGGYRVPYKEEVIISEITINLDDPSADSITIQNFKTQFEDLFKRISATTQTIQFSSGKYERAASVVGEDRTIDIDVLRKTLVKNSVALSYADLQSVNIGNEGITITSPLEPNKILRAINGGIFLTSDGGNTWITGISPDGINTALLTAGQIDVSKITIFSDGSPAFKWDYLGLNAFKKSGDSYSIDTFVRHDQYGLYGIKGYGASFTPQGETEEEKIQFIQDRATFALTWDGFSLRGEEELGYLKITSKEDFEIYRTVEDSGIFVDRLAIKLGKIRRVGSTPVYGLELYDNTGEIVLTQSDNGYLGLTGMIYIGPSFIDSKVRMGNVQSYGTATAVFQARNADNEVTFEIRDDGSAILKGSIEATSGKIAGFDINNYTVGGVTYYNLSSPYIKISNDSIEIKDTEGVVTALLSSTENRLTGVLSIAGNSNISGILSLGNIHIDAQYGAGIGAIYSSNLVQNFSILGDGSITAGNINLTGKIEIQKYIKLNNGYIFNPVFDPAAALAEGINKSNNLFLASGAYANASYAFEVYDTGLLLTKNIRAEGGSLGTLDIDGILNVGTDGVIIDGISGSIHSKSYDSMNGWSILKDGSAYFNNATVRGSIKTAVFEYNTVQAVGGTVLVRPSATIRTFFSTDNQTFIFTVDNSIGFLIGDLCCAQIGTVFDDAIYGTIDAINGMEITVTFSNEITNETFLSSLEGAPLVTFGKDGDVGISINSSNSNTFSTSRAITVFEKNGSAFDPKIILGLIPIGMGLGEIENTYGLYAENVYLKGRMISSAEIGGIQYSSGLNTESNIQIPGESDSSPIVFWAGAMNDQVQNAPFKVTRNGTVYAEKGVFKGTITGSLVKSSIIIGENARTSLNTDKENGLSILGNGGLSFYGGQVTSSGTEITLSDCTTFIANHSADLVINSSLIYSKASVFSISLINNDVSYFFIDSTEKTLMIMKAKIGDYVLEDNLSAFSIRKESNSGYLAVGEEDTSSLNFMAESSFKFGNDKRVYQDVVKDSEGVTLGYDLYITD